MTFLGAGPYAGLKVVGPSQTRASKSRLRSAGPGPGYNLHELGTSDVFF